MVFLYFFTMDVHPEITKLFNQFDPEVRRRKLSNDDAIRYVVFILKTGLPWHHLPVRGVSYHTVFKRFQSWVNGGVIDSVWKHLIQLYSQKQLAINAGWFRELFIDATMIKNVGGRDGLGRNPTDRGRLATKMSVVVDNAMTPLSCEFSPANVHDTVPAVQTIDGIGCKLRNDNRYRNVIVGDKGYVSVKLSEAIRARNMRLLTPRKKNSTNRQRLKRSDKDLLRKRHKVENTFCRLDKFKKIHFRYEKSLKAFRGLTMLAFTLLTISNIQKIDDLSTSLTPSFSD